MGTAITEHVDKTRAKRSLMGTIIQGESFCVVGGSSRDHASSHSYKDKFTSDI